MTLGTLGLSAWALFPAAAPPQQASSTTKPKEDPTAEALRRNNLGVAYMNQQRFEAALELFEQAARLNPALVVARLNQAIALLNQQRFEPALAILREVVEQEPKNVRAWFNLGLLHRATGEAEKALEALERVAELDPEDADSHYFRGLLLAQMSRYEAALAAYQRALALNPFHVSAEFGLAQAYQRLGDAARAREHLARFQQLTQQKLGSALRPVYGEQGRYSFAQEVTPPPGAVPPPVVVRFVVATDEAGLPTEVAEETAEKGRASSLGAGACFFDYDSDAESDLLLVEQRALYRSKGQGRFEEVTESARLRLPAGGMGCTAGDYDNDGWTDLAVSFLDGVRLYRNQGDGTFREVAQEAGIDTAGLALGLTFVDYDHDGDLDLYVARVAERPRGAPDAELHFPLGVAPVGNVLWRNNGNGTFSEQTDAAGLKGTAPSVGAVITDFNNDRAIDFIVTGWGRAPKIFANPREGRFQVEEPWAAAMPGPTAGVVVFDFDKDGWMDLAFTHWSAPGLTLWRNREGKSFEPAPLPVLGWERGWGLAAFDFDNDGWLDLAAVGESAEGSEIRLLRNRGRKGFEDATAAVGLEALELEDPRALLAADTDGDGDADLLVTQHGGPVVLLRNDGGNRNGWLRVSLRGLADNKSAIGTKVEVFAGASWQKWEVPAASGYLGQSSLEVLAGLGEAREADILRLQWPTGVLQDEIQLAARTRHAVNEIDRRGSSCPILFAWNGERFEFISDLIGPAILGHWVAPGERNLPDPDEYVKVEGSRAQPRHGRVEFRFVEPMEELIYLDQVRLLAVDHPAEVDVYPNEYFASQPPFPSFQVIASRGARPPAGAWDHRGRSVLDELQARDRRFVGSFAFLPFKGFAELHGVELELGEWEASKPLRLLLHGLTDYFTATSVYAAHQAGIVPVVPYVEALAPGGDWVRVVDDMGFPAGLRRTMVADLTGRLPAGTRRIRILTNLHIYWDQILIDTTAQDVPVRTTEAPLAAAELAFLGYPRAVEGKPAADLTYVYEEVSATGPYARQRGAYTRYGDVQALLAEPDDRFAIFGAAEEVAVAFDVTRLPPLPDGWVRDYFFYANGFVKDMDFYAAHGATVTPLPFHGMGDYPYPQRKAYPLADPNLRYLLEYNTRWVNGDEWTRFRFDYPPTK